MFAIGNILVSHTEVVFVLHHFSLTLPEVWVFFSLFSDWSQLFPVPDHFKPWENGFKEEFFGSCYQNCVLFKISLLHMNVVNLKSM